MNRPNVYLALGILFCVSLTNPSLCRADKSSPASHDDNEADEDIQVIDVEREFPNIQPEAQQEFPSLEPNAQKEFPNIQTSAQKEFPNIEPNAQKEFSNNTPTVEQKKPDGSASS